MTEMIISKFVTILPEDVYPDFDIDEEPDPGPHFDPVTGNHSAEYLAQRDLWGLVRRYVRMHSRRYVPEPESYSMPEAVHAWAENFCGGRLAEKPVLVLNGPVGVGKTYSASALACYLGAFWDRMFFTDAPTILFKTASLLLGELKNFSSREDRERSHFEATRAKVLVVDDLTRFKTTDFDMESLGQVIDYRNQHGQPTVVTVNGVADVGQLPEILPEFLASRLLAGYAIPIFGPDRRRA